jgi:hypothetical protein
MMQKDFSIQREKLLLVEGVDDKDFFIELFKKIDISDVHILTVDGKGNFATFLQIIANMERFDAVKAIGLIRDADTNAKGAFESLSNSIKKIQLQPPPQVNSFRSQSGVNVGIFIMPRKFEDGMLEDLCLESVQQHGIMPCIDNFVDCISKKLLENEQPKHLSKLKAHIFLSSMPNLVNTVGLGAKKGYWNFDHPCMDELKAFLNNFK